MARYNPNLVAPNNTNLVGQNNACLFCLQPVTNNTILRCCGRSCHINCAHTCHKPSTKRRPIFKCPSCLYPVPLAVLEISPFQPWKEDVRFANQVQAVWKDNPFRYAHSHAIENFITEGYWGRLLHAVDSNRYVIYFLGHTKSEVIPNMRTYLALRLSPMWPPPCSSSDWKY